MGEGGAILTNSMKLARICESYRDWGRDCYCDRAKIILAIKDLIGSLVICQKAMTINTLTVTLVIT